MKIAVAVSGGVDSLCALLTLQRQGHSVLALHARLLDHGEGRENALAALAETRGIPFVLADLRSDFRRLVIEPSMLAWHRGETPNPCALCNRFIKFGRLLAVARELGCEKLATGHYVSLSEFHGVPLFSGARDEGKDQRYFLSLVEPEVLSLLSFPLASVTKAEARSFLQGEGVAVPEKKESQDVCFLPSDQTERRKIFEETWASMRLGLPEGGGIHLVTEDPLREIARHSGLWQYTEGQRKGLGIPFREGLYVLGKGIGGRADLYVGPRAFLGMDSLRSQIKSLFLPPSLWPEDVFVKVRYRQKPYRAMVSLDGDRLSVRFYERVFPSARGQIVSVSDGAGHILAGGILSDMSFPWRQSCAQAEKAAGVVAKGQPKLLR
ncbi:MAG: tRNA-specific 2-thiouridylase [Desulfovibrio sp.]|nr:tRNA-specific 2-thiouridylase [Desulfovibrio sp.]